MITIMSKTVAKISYFVIFILSLVLILYFSLLYGIKIESLTLPQAKIKGLYIKLDKKFIVKADYIKIKKSYAKTDIKSQLLSIKKYFEYFPHIFKKIDIKKIEYDNNNLILRYNKELFFLESDQLYLLIKIKMQNIHALKFDIKKLYLKPYRASFIGILNVDAVNNGAEFDGTLFSHNVNAKVKLSLKKNILQYYFYDVKSNNIAPFMDFLNANIKIEPEISNWIYKYIKAKSYNVKYFFGKLDIKTGDFFPKYMQGLATAKGVEVKFNKNLPKVNIPKIHIKLKNDSLSFELFSPKYQNIDLSGSSVKINNLFSKGAYIDIILKTSYRMDEKIKRILKAYSINIPIYQIDSITDAVLELKINFLPYKLDYKGYFFVKNSHILFKKIKFYIKKGSITLKKSKIFIKNSSIKYKNIFDIVTTGKYDMHTSVYEGDAKIKKLNIEYLNTKLLKAGNIAENIKINFKNGIIYLKNLDVILIFDKYKNYFDFENLKKIHKISPLLKALNIDNGAAFISTMDFNNFLLHADVKYPDLERIVYKNRFLKRFVINGSIDSEGVRIVNDNETIKIEVKKRVDIVTKNLSFDLREFPKSSTKFRLKMPLDIKAYNSTVFLDNNLTIKSDEFELFKNGDKVIFSSVYRKNHIFYSKDSDGVRIDTNFISSDYLNSVINYSLFHGGAFRFEIKEQNSVIKGNCKISNTVIKSIDKKGENFKIKTGEFNFYFRDSILTLDNIKLFNDYSTLKGSGYIDIKNRKLNLKFDVTVLKDLGRTIKSIPFLGYIILGKNGKFGSKVTISGSFDHPVVKSDFAENIIKSPFNMIFRIIKMPLELISN